MRANVRDRWAWAIVALLVAHPSLAASRDLRLVDAAEHREAGVVRALLAEDVDVNAPQADGATALHWAVHWDDRDTADLLIRAGANVNAANDHGVSPLSLACLNGSPALVERLLEAGADPNAARATGETPLMTAAHTGSVNVVQALLSYGADVNAMEPRQGQTALMWAASQKHPAAVRALVAGGADINARSAGGYTPLLFAVREGSVESAKMLLDAGVDVDDPAPDGTWALTLAIASGHETLAVYLLSASADPNAQLGGYSALHAAVASGTPELVRALLARGADPNARLTTRRAPPGGFQGGGDSSASVNMTGATPFWLAAAHLNAALMQLLLDHDADPLLTTDGETTPLMVAAGLGQSDGSENWHESRALDAVRYLVELGADATALSRAGNTALHGAAYMGADSVVRFLVDHGAPLNAQDQDGQTPFRVAQGHRGTGATFIERQGTADVLRALGADTSLGVDPHISFRELGDAASPNRP